ncbi:hypothetical protein Tdes44962_MAKER07937 [Teratosphaeria destructans]|uniref:Uncharacterized protein n=1 Tax=Teratosphaeria destructans TaxID=418781 RepID=A0A9W7SXH3_9PEZI|nr:hypothetical protein Tdes44962_MAKER07937 [Teratosphaeria destructans]
MAPTTYENLTPATALTATAIRWSTATVHRVLAFCSDHRLSKQTLDAHLVARLINDLGWSDADADVYIALAKRVIRLVQKRVCETGLAGAVVETVGGAGSGFAVARWRTYTKRWGQEGYKWDIWGYGAPDGDDGSFREPVQREGISAAECLRRLGKMRENGDLTSAHIRDAAEETEHRHNSHNANLMTPATSTRNQTTASDTALSAGTSSCFDSCPPPLEASSQLDNSTATPSALPGPPTGHPAPCADQASECITAPVDHMDLTPNTSATPTLDTHPLLQHLALAIASCSTTLTTPDKALQYLLHDPRAPLDVAEALRHTSIARDIFRDELEALRAKDAEILSHRFSSSNHIMSAEQVAEMENLVRQELRYKDERIESVSIALWTCQQESEALKAKLREAACLHDAHTALVGEHDAQTSHLKLCAAQLSEALRENEALSRKVQWMDEEGTRGAEVIRGLEERIEGLVRVLGQVGREAEERKEKREGGDLGGEDKMCIGSSEKLSINSSEKKYSSSSEKKSSSSSEEKKGMMESMWAPSNGTPQRQTRQPPPPRSIPPPASADAGTTTTNPHSHPPPPHPGTSMLSRHTLSSPHQSRRPRPCDTDIDADMTSPPASPPQRAKAPHQMRSSSMGGDTHMTTRPSREHRRSLEPRRLQQDDGLVLRHSKNNDGNDDEDWDEHADEDDEGWYTTVLPSASSPGSRKGRVGRTSIIRRTSGDVLTVEEDGLLANPFLR